MDRQPTTGRAAGIDWAKDYHAICVVEETGRVLWEGRFAHEEGGIASLCASLVEMGLLRVAIERPEGLLVERVLEAGIVVLAVHPNQLKASRPRFRASGSRAKSDPFDAFCLAELARTDHHRFRALTPDSDETKALRALTRSREDLVGTRLPWPTGCAQSLRPPGPAQRSCSRRSTRPSLWPSLRATRAPKTPEGSQRSVL
jgi:transposase